ncbi:hypothetical protein GV791_04570 [Nocardia cyriacigeorgica]|uniref:Uncharacterized protein n=2 Tax=Nocardia cyriacigeorgica TaxID=135487 RepID=H6R2J8_NOCCG|nr:hypothetical protein [Nocardia cyriacigeorgica]MBF6083482.1 hypothetical protein [Nocardia cyriacigeorgica]MBF6287024.1 hypothetical protein [Nocardia cyriacigeorgica]MBF6425526.1 hypothetical protein [Nocardia cyriacigeorgica]NEW31836.1 hypothetical protein [Nocardia cyriacigeorgica]CCF61848.1 conserved exported protein of unknown function [Nocardia cyriacigeorgica GUH-2]
MRAPTTRQRLAAIAGRVLTTVLAILATVLFSYLLLHASGPASTPIAPPAPAPPTPQIERFSISH